jgi:hypothetical protein
MTNETDGGSAFPTQQERGTQGEILEYGQSGMSLRDYFAVHASDADIQSLAFKVTERSRPGNWRQLAHYLHADNMLAAREAKV